MATLNDIPDYLKCEHQADSSPGVRLAWGILATLSVGAVIGVVLCWTTRYFPRVTHHWLLAFAGSFVTTVILFGVMHGIAGVHWVANSVAVGIACLLVAAKYVALLYFVSDTVSSPTTPWALFSVMELFITNLTAFCGISIATILCRDGDFALVDLLNMLMVNPLTGRR